MLLHYIIILVNQSRYLANLKSTVKKKHLYQVEVPY